MKKILIINTGGTFNKVYNEISGELEVSSDNSSVEEIIKTSFKNNIEITIKSILHKDSLDLTNEDRELILKITEGYEKVLIVHGTDTIDITANYLSQNTKNKTIVLTGAMKPYSIEKIEATSNLSISLFFLNNCNDSGVFVGMHGLVQKYQNLKKNRKIGKFEIVN